MNINPEYQLQLKSGTNSIYTLNFTLDDGEYPYVISALDIYGNEYQVSGTLIVLDDDTAPPSLEYYYHGDYTDGNSGYIEVIASDLSGLSSDPSGIYPVPNTLGTHDFVFNAVDADNDRADDSLSTRIQVSITIVDDDDVTPEIIISYIGEGTDENPGHFYWDILDSDNGIGGDGDSGFSMIEIKVKYTSEDGLITEEYTITPIETGSWNLPAVLGTYTIEIIAIDNDDDRTTIIDSLSTTITEIQTILDDDIGSPELSDLEITPGIFEINISLVAIDESGIKNITLLINGEVIEPISLIQNGDAYFFTVSNNWLFEKGFSEVEVLVDDSDDDRPNDSLISSISGSFKNILNQMYEYVDWQVEELKDFIEENLCSKVSGKIVKKLSQAQEMLIEAFDLIENGNITSGVRKVYLAKIYINIAEHKTSLYNKINRINYDNALYIIQFLHDIRNNIVYLKGASTGVKQGVDISYIEVELLNLVDLIEPNIKFRSLTNNIRVAAEILEIAIIRISLNKNPKGLLCYVQGKLEYAICKVDHLLRKERISQELADYIINKLSQQIEAIETVKDSLVGYESLKF